MTEQTAENMAPLTRAMLTVCVMMATVMQALDTTLANVALPYEAVLKEVFATALMVDQSLGYKIYEARK